MATLVAIRVQNRASPNGGALPIIWGNVAKTMRITAVANNVDFREIVANKVDPHFRTKTGTRGEVRSGSGDG